METKNYFHNPKVNSKRLIPNMSAFKKSVAKPKDPTPTDFSKGFQLLNTLALNQLLQSFSLITTDNSNAIEVLSSLLYKHYIMILKYALLKWKKNPTHEENVSSGLNILEKQRKRKINAERKARNPTKDMIQQEKALTMVGRIISSMQKKSLLESFIALLKNHIKTEKIVLYIKLKQNKKIRDFISNWRHFADIQYLKRRIFEKLLEKVSQNSIRQSFLGIVSDRNPGKLLKLSIFKMALEKISNNCIRKSFLEIIEDRNPGKALKQMSFASLLERVSNICIRKSFLEIITDRNPKNPLKPKIFKMLLEKLSNSYTRESFLEIIADRNPGKSLKIIIFKKLLEKVSNSHNQKTFLRIIEDRNPGKALKQKVFEILLGKVCNSCIRKSFLEIITERNPENPWKMRIFKMLLEKLSNNYSRKSFLEIVTDKNPGKSLKIIIFKKLLEKVSKPYIQNSFFGLIVDRNPEKNLKQKIFKSLLEKVSKTYIRKIFLEIITERNIENPLKNKIFKLLIEKLINNYTRKSFVEIVVHQNSEKSLKITIFNSLLEKVSSSYIRKSFFEIVADENIEKDLKKRIFKNLLEKVGDRRMRKSFSKIIADRNPGKALKHRIFKGLLEKVTNNYIRKIVLEIVADRNFEKALKAKFAIEKLTFITKNKCFAYFQTLKAQKSSRFQNISARCLIRKILRFEKKSTKKAFSYLVLHTNKTKQNQSATTIIDILSYKLRALKKSVLLSCKYYINTKRNKILLWRVKFYQLAGLMQQKQEENNTVLKREHFLSWRSKVEKILEINRKYAIKRSLKLYSTLRSILEKSNISLQLHSLSQMQALAFSEKRTSKKTLKVLDKILQKQLKFTFFEKWKRKATQLYASPKSYRRSHVPFSSYQEHSPHASLTHRGQYEVPKKFGYYSIKRLSVDNVHKYIDQMIRVIPPSQKCLSPHVFSTAPTISFISESHSRNPSTFTNNR